MAKFLNVLDAVLQPAVDVYNKLRGNAPTGSGTTNCPAGMIYDQDMKTCVSIDSTLGGSTQINCPSGKVWSATDNKCIDKKGVSPLIIVGGVLLLGVGTYFVVKKIKNK